MSDCEVPECTGSHLHDLVNPFSHQRSKSLVLRSFPCHQLARLLPITHKRPEPITLGVFPSARSAGRGR